MPGYVPPAHASAQVAMVPQMIQQRNKRWCSMIDGAQVILVRGDDFRMGSTARPEEMPIHSVFLPKTYWIDGGNLYCASSEGNIWMVRLPHL